MKEEIIDILNKYKTGDVIWEEDFERIANEINQLLSK